MSLVPLMAAFGLATLFFGLTSTPRPEGPRRAASPQAALRFGALLAAALTAGPVALVTGSIQLASVIAIAVLLLPGALARRARAKRLRAAQEAWPDALSSLIAYLRSGASLGDALVRLAETGSPILKVPLERFASTYRSTGNVLPSLASLREGARDPVADHVCVALRVAHEVGGGDLVRVLSAISESVSADLRTRREVEARWSWTIAAARLAALAPWIVISLMSTKPEARSAYGSSDGAAVIFIGALATIVGYGLMLRAGRLPMPKRSLR